MLVLDIFFFHVFLLTVSLFLQATPAKHFLVETAEETAGGAVGEGVREDYAAGHAEPEPEGHAEPEPEGHYEPEPEGEPVGGEVDDDDYDGEDEDEFDDGPASDYEGKRK